MNGWMHKDEWKKELKGCCVVVSRHEVVESEFNMGEGLNRWCVYIYFYRSHPYFSRFDSTDSMSQDAAQEIPLHGGCTFFRRHTDNEDKVTSFQVGCDFNHIYDDRFTYMSTPEDASEVFSCADSIIKWNDALLKALEQQEGDK